MTQMDSKRDKIKSGSNKISMLPSAKIQSKQTQDRTNCSDSDDVKSVRDLFIFGEKHCEPKSFSRMEAWINEECSKLKRVKTGRFQQTGNFLRDLKIEASNKTSYKFVPSPEFKPGSYFLLPENSDDIEYDAQRFDRCVPSYTYVKPSNQLCRNNIMRKAFCEVIGKDLCIDCNGGKLRQRFNHKMDSLFPCLGYDRDKRPYGYCPRSIRLTEPLPSRVERRPKNLNLYGRYRNTTSRNVLGFEPNDCDYDAPMKKFSIKTRPYTR